MARTKNILQITGALGNLSMYNMQGVDQVIVRTKGGPTKKQIKNDPGFEKVRRNNNEWAGCTKMGSQIRHSFGIMNRLEDYPVTGALNAICKQIQKLDTNNEHGERAIRLSQHKDMLIGFPFSRKQVLESVFRVPIETSLNRDSATAQVNIPVINIGMYLYNFRNLPYFRMLGMLGGVTDRTYMEGRNTDGAGYDNQNGTYESEWMPTAGVLPAWSFTLHYPLAGGLTPADVTLILSIGIEFGEMGYDGKPTAVKYAGCGKVVRAE